MNKQLFSGVNALKLMLFFSLFGFDVKRLLPGELNCINNQKYSGAWLMHRWILILKGIQAD